MNSVPKKCEKQKIKKLEKLFDEDDCENYEDSFETIIAEEYDFLEKYVFIDIRSGEYGSTYNIMNKEGENIMFLRVNYDFNWDCNNVKTTKGNDFFVSSYVYKSHNIAVEEFFEQICSNRIDFIINGKMYAACEGYDYEDFLDIIKHINNELFVKKVYPTLYDLIVNGENISKKMCIVDGTEFISKIKIEHKNDK